MFCVFKSQEVARAFFACIFSISRYNRHLSHKFRVRIGHCQLFFRGCIGIFLVVIYLLFAHYQEIRAKQIGVHRFFCLKAIPIAAQKYCFFVKD